MFSKKRYQIYETGLELRIRSYENLTDRIDTALYEITLEELHCDHDYLIIQDTVWWQTHVAGRATEIKSIYELHFR